LITLDMVRQRAQNDAQTYGYYLNPDPGFLQDLLEGLKTNEERYGYPSCPCRVASGKLELDRDIICPCDYRDSDVRDFGFCYCALYVRKDVVDGEIPVTPIPERRPPEKLVRAGAGSAQRSASTASAAETMEGARLKMWYCRQCGYVCFREDPPYVCPICKAKRELFAEVVGAPSTQR
jgi:ferredoxin-thioredoxin reductase catalytic chain